MDKFSCQYQFVSQIKYLITDWIRRALKLYVCSFCKNPDYLPAWRYYGKNGLGFSIGFSEQFFRIDNDYDGKTNGSVLIPEILYDDLDLQKTEHIENLIKQLLDRTNAEISNIKALKKGNSAFIQTIQYLSLHFISELPGIKHPDWATENEGRLFISEVVKDGKILTPQLSNDYKRPKEPRQGEKKEVKSIFPKIEICTKTIDIPYLEKTLLPNDISEIWIGPANKENFEKLKKEIIEMLPEEFKNIEIKYSLKHYKS